MQPRTCNDDAERGNGEQQPSPTQQATEFLNALRPSPWLLFTDAPGFPGTVIVDRWTSPASSPSTTASTTSTTCPTCRAIRAPPRNRRRRRLAGWSGSTSTSTVATARRPLRPSSGAALRSTASRSRRMPSSTAATPCRRYGGSPIGSTRRTSPCVTASRRSTRRWRAASTKAAAATNGTSIACCACPAPPTSRPRRSWRRAGPAARARCAPAGRTVAAIRWRSSKRSWPPSLPPA